MTLQSASAFRLDARRAVDFMLYSLKVWYVPFANFSAADLQAYDAVSKLPASGILRERDAYALLWELERLRVPNVYYPGGQVTTYSLSALTTRLRLRSSSTAWVSHDTALRVLALIRSARLYAINYGF